MEERCDWMTFGFSSRFIFVNPISLQKAERRVFLKFFRFCSVTMSVALAALYVSSAFGQASQPKKQQQKSKSHLPKRTVQQSNAKSKAFGSDSSSDLRSSKSLFADILLTPLSDFSLIYGARLGYQSDASIQFSSKFLAGRSDLKSKFPQSETITVQKSEMTGLAGSLDLRYFFGHSFSIQGGAGFRRANIDISVTEVSGLSVDVKQSLSAVDALFGLGNHWMWSSGLTLGCDWIVVMVPLSSSYQTITSSNVADEEINTVINEKVAENLKRVSVKLAVTLGLFSIGYSF